SPAVGYAHSMMSRRPFEESGTDAGLFFALKEGRPDKSPSGTDAGLLFALREECTGNSPQISSVMNGMIGCSARSTASSTTSKVCRVEAAAATSFPFSAGLGGSPNQSQYSFQTNS